MLIVGLDDVIKKRIGKRTIGFGAWIAQIPQLGRIFGFGGWAAETAFARARCGSREKLRLARSCR